MADYYIMNGYRGVQKINDIYVWGKWMNDNREMCSIMRTELPNGVTVSTIFLGLNHNYFPTGYPILFETMVFGGELDLEQERYRDIDEAEQGHERMVWRVQQASVAHNHDKPKKQHKMTPVYSPTIEYKKPVLVDAQQMAVENPQTFEVPSIEGIDELLSAAVNSDGEPLIDIYAKVCVSEERFWVHIAKVDADNIYGVINNDLVLTERHKLRDGDSIQFEKKHIYSIC